MKLFKSLYFLLPFLLLGCSNRNMPKEFYLTSPNGRNSLKIELKNKSATNATLTVNQNELLRLSLKGLSIKGREDLQLSNFEIHNVEKNSLNDSINLIWGENKVIPNIYNEIAYRFTNRDNHITIRIRAFNEGIAFRYEYDIKSIETDSLTILEELTTLTLPDNMAAWYTHANENSYELDYCNDPIDQVQDANLPFTFGNKAIGYGVFLEANLNDFTSMTLLKVDSTANCFSMNLVPYPNGDKAYVSKKFITPWRVIVTGEKSIDLINNNHLLLCLNDPCKIDNTSWIKPIKYTGVWWEMHLGISSWEVSNRHGATTQKAFEYIDFAKKNNIDAVLFEGWNDGWETWGASQSFDHTIPAKDFDLLAVLDSCKTAGIKWIAHNETGANIPLYEKQIENTFKFYNSLGINYLKTGYAGGIPNGYKHHGQYAIRHFRKVIETGAKYNICIDAHETIMDSGLRRTYPNIMTRESSKGMEWNAWSKGNSAEHTLILPFTRLVAGPMDYTPGIFNILFDGVKENHNYKKWNDQDTGESRVHTTLSRQIANWILLYSPMQMAADLKENYINNPAFEAFKSIDIDFDESKAISGEIGEYLILYRRTKNRFFVAGGVDAKDWRQFKIDFDFLPSGKNYMATIYSDSPQTNYLTNPTEINIYNKNIRSGQRLDINVAPAGGFLIVLEPIEN